MIILNILCMFAMIIGIHDNVEGIRYYFQRKLSEKWILVFHIFYTVIFTLLLGLCVYNVVRLGVYDAICRLMVH